MWWIILAIYLALLAWSAYSVIREVAYWDGYRNGYKDGIEASGEIRRKIRERLKHD